MRYAIGRWTAIVAATIIAGTLTDWLAELWFPSAIARNPPLLALTLIGAGVGFWFAYTGRLARLFRKVG